MCKIRYVIPVLFITLVSQVSGQNRKLELSLPDGKPIVFRLLCNDLLLESKKGIIEITPGQYVMLKDKIVRLLDENGKIIGEDKSCVNCIKIRIVEPGLFRFTYWTPRQLEDGETLAEILSMRNRIAFRLAPKPAKKEMK